MRRVAGFPRRRLLPLPPRLLSSRRPAHHARSCSPPFFLSIPQSREFSSGPIPSTRLSSWGWWGTAQTCRRLTPPLRMHKPVQSCVIICIHYTNVLAAHPGDISPSLFEQCCLCVILARLSRACWCQTTTPRAALPMPVGHGEGGGAGAAAGCRRDEGGCRLWIGRLCGAICVGSAPT